MTPITFLSLVAIFAVGAGCGYFYTRHRRQQEALAAKAPPPPVRDAGPDHMQTPPRKWDTVDQQADESFPASDPPGNY